MTFIKSAEEQAGYVVQMREWINGQPHLPKDLEDNFLLRFAHSCYYDLDKTKTTVETFITVRNSCTELLTNRDPLSPHIQKMFKIMHLGNYMISDKRRLWVWQLNDPGLEAYDHALDAKLIFLSTDAFFMTDTGLPEADIILLDAKDITWKFITKINLSVARKITKYQEDAVPIRLKQIHIINAPSVINKIYALLKPFMKKENAEMIHFHTPKSETIYKYIAKDELPEDLGGLKPTFAELNKNCLKLIMDKREQLIDENLWRIKKIDCSAEADSLCKLVID